MSDDHRLSDPQAPASRPVEETQIFSDGTHPEGDSPSGTLPKKFGRYEIERVLGEGAMGAVLLATDTQLQREVALKIPKFARGADPQMLERFFLEARLAATLNHPNICPVFDVWALARDNSQPVQIAETPATPETTDAADTKMNATPVSSSDKPAPPVATERVSPPSIQEESPATSARERVTRPVKTRTGTGSRSFPTKSRTEQTPSKDPSPSLPETPTKVQPDTEKPPLPSPPGNRGPRFGPPPRPGGPSLPPGVTVDVFFRQFDKNRDNKLTPDEIPDEIRDHLFRADANSDGYLVKKELRDAEGGHRKPRRGKKPR